MAGKGVCRSFLNNKPDKLISTSPHLHQHASTTTNTTPRSSRNASHRLKSGRRKMRSEVSGQRVTSDPRAGEAALTAHRVYFPFTDASYHDRSTPSHYHCIRHLRPYHSQVPRLLDDTETSDSLSAAQLSRHPLAARRTAHRQTATISDIPRTTIALPLRADLATSVPEHSLLGAELVTKHRPSATYPTRHKAFH